MRQYKACIGKAYKCYRGKLPFSEYLSYEKENQGEPDKGKEFRDNTTAE
jgi:hypothetical protein